MVMGWFWKGFWDDFSMIFGDFTKKAKRCGGPRNTAWAHEF